MLQWSHFIFSLSLLRSSSRLKFEASSKVLLEASKSIKFPFLVVGFLCHHMHNFQCLILTFKCGSLFFYLEKQWKRFADGKKELHQQHRVLGAIIILTQSHEKQHYLMRSHNFWYSLCCPTIACRQRFKAAKLIPKFLKFSIILGYWWSSLYSSANFPSEMRFAFTETILPLPSIRLLLILHKWMIQ